MRRGPSSGRFLPHAARDTAPLFHVAAKSERVAKGNRTRASLRRLRALAMFGVRLDAR
jgi:hypothetical protein